MAIRKPLSSITGNITDLSGRDIANAAALGAGSFADGYHSVHTDAGALASGTIKLTFEGDGFTGDFGAVGTYQGLTFTNINYLRSQFITDLYGETGYTNGLVSGENVGYTTSDNFGEITSGGGNFDFKSVYMTAAWRIGLTVDVYGYDDGVQKYHETFTISDDKATNFKLNWTGVDTIDIAGSGGAHDPNIDPGLDGPNVVFDNFIFGGSNGSISGTLFNDKNANGEQDSGEKGFKGRTVFVDLNHNGLLDNGEYSAVTDKQGHYKISGVPFGSYDVVQVLPDNYRQTSPYDTTFSYDIDDGGKYKFVNIEKASNLLAFTGDGTSGTPENLDDGYSQINFSHAVSFYGHDYTSAYVSTNGFITFQTPSTLGFSNTSLPSDSAPNALIAAFWDDFNLNEGGSVYFKDDASHHQFIVTWKDVNFYGTSNTASVTFQALVGYDGTVKYEYSSVAGLDGSATIGVEDPSGTEGTQYSFNTVTLADHSVVTFDPTETVTSAPAHVNVDSGSETKNVDFGSHDVSAITGGIHGVAYEDVNGDGHFSLQDGDSLKSGWTVFIDTNNNGRHDTGEAITTTDANGEYHFATLDPGTYTVVTQAPFGWQHYDFGGTAGGNPMLSSTPAASPVSTVDAYKAHVADTQAEIAASGHKYYAADWSAEHVENQLVVKVDPSWSSAAGIEAQNALMASVGATLVKSTVALGVQLWQVNGMSIEDAASRLMASGHVAYANPNYIVHADGHQVGSAVDAGDVAAASGGVHTASTTPNDPGYGQEYGLPQINAPGAWDYSTGSHSVVVGNIDTGIDVDHPDLVNNLWTNTGEIAGDGIDNDDNGYVDDVHGYDFVNSDGNPDDDNEHGTHTSGTIGAQGDNGVGVSGVNWDVSIMGLKFLDATGHGSTFDATLAVEYATMMGAKVTNNSWGGGGFDNGLYDAIAAGGLFIAAAGNSGQDNDVTPSYPASYDLDNIIAVAAVDANKHIASFSQYGATSVDLGAPGVAVLSTVPVEDGSYAFFSGTSMATPHVTGAVALMEALFPNMTGAEIKAALLAGVQANADLAGKTLTGGELDLMGTLNSLSHGSQIVTVVAQQVTEADFGATSTATFGNDKIQGYNLAEVINSLAGNDTVKGGAGDDTLIGGVGSDKLYGEAGGDTFFFNSKSGSDKIYDFSHSEHDKIQIDAKGITQFSDLSISSDGAGGSLVKFGASSIDVIGINPTSLDGSDFTFGKLSGVDVDGIGFGADAHPSFRGDLGHYYTV